LSRSAAGFSRPRGGALPLRIDAAQEANRQAPVSKGKAQIQAARTQLQQVWAGLQPYRVAAVTKTTPLLTPDQLKVLEDPKN